VCIAVCADKSVPVVLWSCMPVCGFSHACSTTAGSVMWVDQPCYPKLKYILKATGWIAVKFGTDICIPWRMSPTDSGDSQTFHQVPAAGQMCPLLYTSQYDCQTAVGWTKDVRWYLNPPILSDRDAGFGLALLFICICQHVNQSFNKMSVAWAFLLSRWKAQNFSHLTATSY